MANPSASTTVAATLQPIPAPPGVVGTAANVQFGIPRPPQQQVLLYSSAEWEELVLEYATGLASDYKQVLRFAGSGDAGIDVAGFTDANGLHGVWDNYQCKHYQDSLPPSVASPEIAKILWHSFQKTYLAPRRYYFVAPHECAMSLRKLLAKPNDLRDYVIANWDTQCAAAVVAKTTIPLVGAFRTYVDSFDFTIFSQRTLLELVDTHRKTRYHATRFGGGLPPRPPVTPPPYDPTATPSRYVRQLFDAYDEHTGSGVTDLVSLAAHPELVQHFHRQREFFFHAEALRNFARDNVPTGTFEDLQSEVHAGVADVEAGSHLDGYARLNAVTQAAATIQLTANALITAIRVHDRKGICHQLADQDRLKWRKP